MLSPRSIFYYLMFVANTLFAESPDLRLEGENFIYADLQKGDSRDEVFEKLRGNGFIQIYEEREKELIKCSIRWNGFRYELVCKFQNNSLEFCLVEGLKGWQEFFYEDVLQPQWISLREKVEKVHGIKRVKKEFPKLEEVPIDDLAGYITDTWDLSDRTLILTIQSFKVKDCCTDQMIEYSNCSLLIHPK